WIGAIEQDDSYSMFEAQIENRGGGSVIAHVYAARLEGRNGKRIRRIDRAIELHWRGDRSEEKAILYRGKHEIAGILQTVTELNGKPIDPTPCLTAPGPPGVLAYTVVPLRNPTPLGLQEIVYLTIRVDFHEIREDGTEGKCVATETKKVAI